MCWLPLKIRPLPSTSALVVLWKRCPLKSWHWMNLHFCVLIGKWKFPLPKPTGLFFFSFCFCIRADVKQMQNPACSSSTCEPGAPAPNTSASLKPVKIHGCSSQMCWGKQAGRSHSFSTTVEHLALSTMIFWWKTANMPTYWEHLCWSRGNFLYLEKNCLFCGSPSSQFIVSL